MKCMQAGYDHTHCIHVCIIGELSPHNIHMATCILTMAIICTWVCQLTPTSLIQLYSRSASIQVSAGGTSQAGKSIVHTYGNYNRSAERL